MKKYLAAKLSRQSLILLLCLLGVIASAVWTSAVGHTSNKTLPQSPQPAGYYNTYTSSQAPVSGASQSSLPTGGSSQVEIPAAGNAQTGSGEGTTSTPQLAPAEPDPLYPVDPTPCKTYVNGKAYCVYCDNSGSATDSLACGGCYGGGGLHPEIMCPY